MPASDEELATLVAAAGDRAAFGELIRRHQGVVRGMLARLTRDRALADDLAQDAFIRAFERIGSFRGEGGFKAWLCRIAYTEMLQTQRRRRSRERTQEGLRVLEEIGSTAAADRGDIVDLDRALAQLSAHERACVVLCYACGMSHSEAAEATGLPPGTVKSHVNRGREKMKALMSSEVVGHDHG
jgi:RNA polymerase sigma-70 factor (ECF subfamily)